MFGFPFSEGDRKLKGAQISLKTRTKCGVVPDCQAAAPGGTREPTPSPSASRSGRRRPQLPAARTEPDPAPSPVQTELRWREPRARRDPPVRGRASCHGPGSHPLIRGRPREERSLRKGVQPDARAPRDGEERKEGHLNPGAAGGARPGQPRRRSDSPGPPERRGRQPVEALRGAAAEWH